MNMLNNFTGIAKRKTSIAKVYLSLGSGEIILNNINIKNLKISNKFIENLKLFIFNIFKINDIIILYDINIKTKGGGISSQLDAINLAISKAISKIDIKYKILLSKKSFLTSDSRIKERKKYGLKKARKAFQFTKR